MSDTTQLVVLHDIVEPPDVVERLAVPLPEQRPLRRVEWDGVHPVWATALSRVALEEVVANLSRIPWRFPQNVQVLIKRERDQRFEVWTFAGPSLTQLLDGNPE